jgi:hypothetical protein
MKRSCDPARWRAQVDHEQGAEDQCSNCHPAPPVGDVRVQAEEPDTGRVDQAGEADLCAHQCACCRYGVGLIESRGQSKVDRKQQAEAAKCEVHALLSMRRPCEHGVDTREKTDAAGNQQTGYVQSQTITDGIPRAVAVGRLTLRMLRLQQRPRPSVPGRHPTRGPSLVMVVMLQGFRMATGDGLYSRGP